MKSQLKRQAGMEPRGFTLVITLLILAVVTVLVMGLFGLADGEKQTANSFDAIEQADLAIKAGLAQATTVLEEVTRSETGLIFAKPVAPQPSDAPGSKGREYLLATRYNLPTVSWEYFPLVSGVQRPLNSANLTMDVDGDGYDDPPQAFTAPTEEEFDAMKTVPHHSPSQPRPIMFWENLVLPAGGEDETLKARFCYAVEDLQAGVSLEHSGNLDTEVPTGTGPTSAPLLLHSRPAFKVTAAQTNHVVPGLNLDWPNRPLLNQIALYTLIDPLTNGDTAAILADNRIVSARTALLSPDSWKQLMINRDLSVSWAGANDAFFERDANHKRYMFGAARRLEDGTSTMVRSYDEGAFIPTFSDGSFAGLGLPKLNLNRLIEELEELKDPTEAEEREIKSKEAIATIAEHILEYLPEFAKGRIGTDASGVAKGYTLGGEEEEIDANADGEPDPPTEPPTEEEKQLAYLKTLAAGMIDYADTDSLPSLRLGHYRGFDSHPIVNEQWQKYEMLPPDQTLPVTSMPGDAPAGRYLVYRITHFVELWNPTNHVVSGEIQYSFECNGQIQTSVELYDIYSVLKNKERPEGRLILDGNVPTNEAKTAEGNEWWHAPVVLQPMKPNEYRVVKFGPVQMLLREGPISTTEVMRARFSGYDGNGSGSDLSSGYKLRFKPKGTTEMRLVDSPRRPIERYTREVTETSGSRRRFNLSLPGMSYGFQNGAFRNQVGDARAAFFINAYQDVVNYENGSSPWGRNRRSNIAVGKVYGESRTTLWPDGGHSTAQTGVSGSNNLGRDSQNPEPFLRGEYNDPDLQRLTNKPTSEPDRFVQHLSNRGRLFSVTELGNVFDPLMWAPFASAPAATQTPADPLYRDFANLRPGASAPSDQYCGGSTLRIGRADHSRFLPDYRQLPAAGRVTNRRLSASALLDLFHCGIPRSQNIAERRGGNIRIDGHININTASVDALRAVIAGKYMMDALAKESNSAPTITDIHPARDKSPANSSSAAAQEHGDFIAREIIKHRPYLSVSELPEKVLVARESLGLTAVPNSELVPLFGHTGRASDQAVAPQWNDLAAEELFGRLFNSSTVRSRNFRITVTGQTVRTTPSGDTVVLATRSRVYNVFIRPVSRDVITGRITEQKVEITYARSL
jgi:hypothetical protein